MNLLPWVLDNEDSKDYSKMLSVIRDWTHLVIYRLVKSARVLNYRKFVAWVNCASLSDFDKFNGNIELTWKPIKGLTLESYCGYNYALSTIRKLS